MKDLFIRFLCFVAEYYIGIIGVSTVLMTLIGIVFSIVNGLYGLKFVPKDMWDGILVVAGVNALALAPKLTEFAKYYVKSKFNTEQGVDPDDVKEMKNNG